MLCLEPWGYPSQTIHLKTASWPWQKASSDCQSTPVCWSMPSSSGDWGKSLEPSNAMLPSMREPRKGHKGETRGKTLNKHHRDPGFIFWQWHVRLWCAFQLTLLLSSWGMCPCCCASDSHSGACTGGDLERG